MTDPELHFPWKVERGEGTALICYHDWVAWPCPIANMIEKHAPMRWMLDARQD